MPFFKNVFKSKDASRSASKAGASEPAAPKLRWEDSWSRKDVAPEEIQELVHFCTHEMKSRGLDMPFMLLPFRPASDTSASRNFVRNFFKAAYEGTRQYSGDSLVQELRLTEPLTLCSIMKWCWSRLPGGVVTWDAYELFREGESDSNFARHAFDTFIPLSVDSDARKRIIFNFFDLLAAVAANGKKNGMGGRKLSRMAGWWAFEFVDDGKGFDGGYRTWERAADAASHLFFAYLRSLSPDATTLGGISTLPRSLQSLLAQTEYPPHTPTLLQTSTTKVVMIVDNVSPTPFSLLRRAKNFQYRDDDAALQQFSAYDDTVKALTDECRRVLECIAAVNQSAATQDPTSPDPTWSRFEDFGFAGLIDTSESSTNGGSGNLRDFSNFQSKGRSNVTDLGRPTTPSWADFLSSGFADENNQSGSSTLLSPSQKLPPLGEPARVHSSQSHVRNGASHEEDLEPGELASITKFDLDDAFWWVWMVSLANEETTERKAAFGRCTLIETRIPGAKWLVMEEQVKGAAAGPEEGAYIAEKKSKFSFTRRGRLGRRKSTGKKPASANDPYSRGNAGTPTSTIGADQHARIQAAAAKLAQKDRDEKAGVQLAQRRARRDEASSIKTNSVLTLQPHLLTDAGPAMKWDKRFGEGAREKAAVRAQYLGDLSAGKGTPGDLVKTANGCSSPLPPEVSNRSLPALPASSSETPNNNSQVWKMPQAKKNPEPVAVVPWPDDSPLHTPLPTEDKALESGNPASPHPALRKVSSEQPAIAPVETRASEEVFSSSEQKVASNKLKKKEAGGFRKFFGRKKTDTTAPPKVTQSRQSEDSSRARSLAAARSTSRVENYNDHRAASPAVSMKQPQPEPTRTLAPAFEPSPAPSPVIQPTPEHWSTAQAPSSAALEQQEADQPFSRFDQGPMEDMPAFAPEDSDDEDHTAAPDVARRMLANDVRPFTPAQQTARARDDMSEDSIDVGKSVSPSQDRWAQIRKNAADRAARLSEEQIRRSRSQSQSQRTDEGETSGEETIESRVARIKARVAELTGNVDGQPVRNGVGTYR